jgi:hypothetical protein
VSTTVAHTHSFVIGVDTHARTHTYAVLTSTGEYLGTEAFPNTHAGRARAIAWAARRTGGDLGALWVIEGIGSYGVSSPARRGLPATGRSRRPGWAGPGAAGWGCQMVCVGVPVLG